MKFILLTLFVALTSAKDDYRLPTSVIPENYKLDILTHLGPEETNFKFIGEVKIEVSTKQLYQHCFVFHTVRTWQNCCFEGFNIWSMQ